MMKPLNPIHRLAIIYPKAIGDFFFILPALHTIRHALRDVHITLVIKHKQAPLAIPQKGCLVDDVLVIGGGITWRTVRQELTTRNIDTVIDMAGNDQSGLLMAFRDGHRLRPHRLDCKGICACYSMFADALPALMPGQHRVEELLSYARILNASKPIYSFALRLPDKAVDASEAMIEKYALRSGRVIVLNVGASRESKRWPAAHFMALCRGLVEAGSRVVLTGAKTFKADGHYDRDTAAQFAQEGLIDGTHCIDLISDSPSDPVLQLQRDAYFLRYSKVAAVTVGNDTGPMHIAGSVGEDARNRTLSLFGPTSWRRYAPYDPTRRVPDGPSGIWNHVCHRNPGCGPVGTQEACRGYRRKCTHRTCMQSLDPETVFDALCRITQDDEPS